jgi:superfamily II DNA/RNA helicase
VKRLLDVTQADRQTMLFSATLDGAVDVLVRRYQHEPRRHEITDDEGEPGDVRHLFWKTDTTNRVALTADVVARHGSAIVFCRTKHGADRLVKQLGGAGVPAVAIHGNRSQPQRERALQQFSSGAARALVATDVAARGIHVDAVGCVVHFDPPADHKDYVHRSGRTGRAGVDGTVVSLVMHEQVRAARLLQRALGMAEGVEPADVELLGDRVPMKPMRPTEAPQPSSDRPRRSDGAGERSGRRGGEPRGGQGRGRPQGQSRRPHRGSGGQSKAPGARGGHARAR